LGARGWACSTMAQDKAQTSVACVTRSASLASGAVRGFRWSCWRLTIGCCSVSADGWASGNSCSSASRWREPSASPARFCGAGVRVSSARTDSAKSHASVSENFTRRQLMQVKAPKDPRVINDLGFFPMRWPIYCLRLMRAKNSMNRANLQREARRPDEQSRERADVVKECGGKRGSALLVLTGFATESSRSRRAPKGRLCPICSLIAWVTSSLPTLSPVSMSCT
jgi:hypothetical protein